MLGPLEPAAAGDDDLGFRQLHLALGGRRDRRDARARLRIDRGRYHLGLSRVVGLAQGEDVRAQGRHLGLARPRHRGEGLAGIHGPAGHELAVLQRQGDAVGNEAGAHSRRHARRQVLAQGRVRNENGRGLGLRDLLGQGARVGLGRIGGESGIVEGDDLVGAVARQLPGQGLDPAPHEHGANGGREGVGEPAGLGDGFEGRPAELPVSSFGEGQDHGGLRSPWLLRGEGAGAPSPGWPGRPRSSSRPAAGAEARAT